MFAELAACVTSIRRFLSSVPDFATNLPEVREMVKVADEAQRVLDESATRRKLKDKRNQGSASIAGLPEWSDPRVQEAYKILVDEDTEPPEGHHWEGYSARRIVAALESTKKDPSLMQTSLPEGMTSRTIYRWEGNPMEEDGTLVLWPDSPRETRLHMRNFQVAFELGQNIQKAEMGAFDRGQKFIAGRVSDWVRHLT